ncbi:hypothetical protein AYO38_01945 [bacterium SCGC AG-212-C10]|nr:hypothetical protein AYO38_01945 [bacterium SCGC AG-212-C10]
MRTLCWWCATPALVVPSNRPAVRRLVREALGHESLRPGQEEAILAVLSGRDTLAVLATGTGKSAIYQAAGVKLPGPTIVVSPLIALQDDQVDGIEENDTAPAAALNSTLTQGQREELMQSLGRGEIEFLFVTPEQLARDDVREALQGAAPSLFVVDEAHCVSEWGQSFRPDYLDLDEAIVAIGRPTILALTATASPPVRAEICERLGMKDPALIVHGLDRANIALEVAWCTSEAERLETLLERFATVNGAAIIYAATRRRTETVTAALCDSGWTARAYHAGLSARERREVHTEFAEGRLPIVVATTAFGMGIDKADVRAVFHIDAPGSIEAYYQEIGRAGRDGEASSACLLFRPEDLAVRRYFASSAGATPASVKTAADAIASGARTPEAIAEATDLSVARARSAIRAIEEAGALRPSGALRASAIDRAVDSRARRQEYERSRVEMLRRYVELRDCRGRFLLEYFGERAADDCGHCDNCANAERPRECVPDPSDDAPYPVQSRVRHAEWGEGSVVRVETDRLTVLFDGAGYRVLALDLVEGRLDRV